MLKKEVDVATLNVKLTDTLLNVPSSSAKKASELNNIIFNSNLYAKHCDSEGTSEDDEETNLLRQQRSVSVDDPVVTKISCSGADGDIPWIALIVCVVVVIFAIPVIYVVYIAEHFEEHHNHSSS